MIICNLKLFCEVKTPILSVPCQVHKQNLNEKQTQCSIHICIFFHFEVILKNKNKIILFLWLINTFDE